MSRLFIRLLCSLCTISTGVVVGGGGGGGGGTSKDKMAIQSKHGVKFHFIFSV